jgi:hypothetical protein
VCVRARAHMVCVLVGAGDEPPHTGRLGRGVGAGDSGRLGLSRDAGAAGALPATHACTCARRRPPQARVPTPAPLAPQRSAQQALPLLPVCPCARACARARVRVNACARVRTCARACAFRRARAGVRAGGPGLQARTPTPSLPSRPAHPVTVHRSSTTSPAPAPTFSPPSSTGSPGLGPSSRVPGSAPTHTTLLKEPRHSSHVLRASRAIIDGGEGEGGGGSSSSSSSSSSRRSRSSSSRCGGGDGSSCSNAPNRSACCKAGASMRAKAAQAVHSSYWRAADENVRRWASGERPHLCSSHVPPTT